MEERLKDQEKRKTLKTLLKLGTGLIAASTISQILLPTSANSSIFNLVKVEYAPPTYPSDAYLTKLTSPDSYPENCDLYFGVLKNTMKFLGKDKGTIKGYFGISLSEGFSQVTVDFHTSKESRLTVLTEDKINGNNFYSEDIDQRIPKKDIPFLKVDLNDKENVLYTLNIPRMVRETMNEKMKSTGVVLNGRGKDKPKMYRLMISNSSDEKFNPIIEGYIPGGADLNNIRVYCKRFNGKIVPVEIRGIQKIKLKGIISDKIEIRAVLEER